MRETRLFFAYECQAVNIMGVSAKAMMAAIVSVFLIL